jgi:hypothetical protein
MKCAQARHFTDAAVSFIDDAASFLALGFAIQFRALGKTAAK